MKGTAGTRKNMVSSIFLEPDDLEEHQRRMEAKYIRAQQTETRCEEYRTEDAELIVVGYGIVSRVLRSAVDEARKQGIKVGLFRPITLWPFPSKELLATALRSGKSSGRRTEQRPDGGRCPPGAEWQAAGRVLRTRRRQCADGRRVVGEDRRAGAGGSVRARSPGRIRPGRGIESRRVSDEGVSRTWSSK